MLTTVDTLKAELSISGSDQDTALEALINQASAAIESYCGRQFQDRTVTDTFRNRSRREAVILSVIPVTDINTVTESGTVLEASDYELESARSGLLLRLDSNDNLTCWAAAKIVIEYNAGYVLPGVDGANLPADIERVCIDLCVRAYHATGRDTALTSEEVPGVIKQTFSTATIEALSEDVLCRLNPYRLIAL